MDRSSGYLLPPITVLFVDQRIFIASFLRVSKRLFSPIEARVAPPPVGGYCA
jgi:hypothetical protein